MIVIFGASSTIGRATIPLLRAKGLRLRLVSRTPETLAEFAGEGVEIVQADLLDADSVQRAVAGAEMVFASVASLLGRGKNAAKHVDYAGQCALIDSARAAGVQHFVYMSAQEATHDNPVAFFRYKAQTEDYLRESGLSYTILRPSAFFSPHVELIGEDVLKGGKAMIMGVGQTPRNFVANEDVAQFAAIALTDPRAKNQTIEIGGLDNLTATQVAEIYARAVGVEPKQRHIPRALLQVMATLTRPFHIGISDLLRAIIDSDTRSKAFDVAPTLAEYPVELTRLEDWVEAQVR